MLVCVYIRKDFLYIIIINYLFFRMANNAVGSERSIP